MKKSKIVRGIPGYSAVVYTGGTFDLPHSGHLELISYCRQYAGKYGKVIVSLNTDEFIQDFKHKAPTMSYEERKNIISNFKDVDMVIKNSGGRDSKVSIQKVKPDIIIVGMDWVEKNYCQQMNFDANWLNNHKISLVYVPRTTGSSTTVLKQRILNTTNIKT